MQTKLYGNIKRMTTVFGVGILCVTVSVAALRLTVFSDMAAAPSETISNMYSSEEDGYQLNSKVYFSNAKAKGDVYISNLSAENLMQVDIVLAETQESILNTGLISSGVSINTAFMNTTGQQLEDGVYPCIANITSYSPDDVKKAIGTATVEIDVYIGEKPQISE